MRLHENCSGLEAIPLRLMIIAVVASLSIVPAADMLQNLKNREFVRRAVLQLEDVITTAEVLAIEGPGGARTLALDFRGDGHLRFRALHIGDADGGPNMSAAVLRLSDGAAIIRMTDTPPVWLRSADGESLEITSPVLELRMCGTLEGQTFYVLVEAR
ncbi:MAG: hypothetical protein ACUVT7_04800 [Thermoplasmata archaeon]